MAQDTGSAAAKILQVATEVLTIVTLTALAALACILAIWVTVRIVRRRRARHQGLPVRLIKRLTVPDRDGNADGRPGGATLWEGAKAGTMNHMLDIRPYTARDAPATIAIVRGLPDYFTDNVPAQVERDAAIHEAWVITDSGAVTGFVVAARKSPGGAEILWIAVDAAWRGRGHGTKLLGYVLDHLAAAGVSVVEAKTLDRSSGYHPYEATRAFWERNGFVYVDTIDPLPGWPAGNPAAIYVAAVRPTREQAVQVGD